MIFHFIPFFFCLRSFLSAFIIIPHNELTELFPSCYK